MMQYKTTYNLPKTMQRQQDKLNRMIQSSKASMMETAPVQHRLHQMHVLDEHGQLLKQNIINQIVAMPPLRKIALHDLIGLFQETLYTSYPDIHITLSAKPLIQITTLDTNAVQLTIYHHSFIGIELKTNNIEEISMMVCHENGTLSTCSFERYTAIQKTLQKAHEDTITAPDTIRMDDTSTVLPWMYSTTSFYIDNKSIEIKKIEVHVAETVHKKFHLKNNHNITLMTGCSFRDLVREKNPASLNIKKKRQQPEPATPIVQRQAPKYLAKARPIPRKQHAVNNDFKSMQRQQNVSEQLPTSKQKPSNTITSLIGTLNARAQVLLTVSKAIPYFYHARKWLFILPNLLIKSLIALISSYWIKKHLNFVTKQTIHRDKIQHYSVRKMQKKSLIHRIMHPYKFNL